ncbi:MAG: hypothetical protein QNJ49_02885 [Mastigocoleus sp. MO_167.B18]|nr:hypothetical protein [Mastigocoleus sp. MO_167.B18]
MSYESQNTGKIRIKNIFAVVSLIVISSLLASCRLRQNSLSQPTPNRDSQTTSPTDRSTISPRSSRTQTTFPNNNSRGEDRFERERRQNNNSRRDNNRQDNRGNNNTQQNRDRRNRRSHPCRL